MLFSPFYCVYLASCGVLGLHSWLLCLKIGCLFIVNVVTMVTEKKTNLNRYEYLPNKIFSNRIDRFIQTNLFFNN